MITCQVGKNKIDTFSYKEKQIREWSDKGLLKCPVCESKMIYHHGEFKMPHFKHSKNNDCPDIYSEGVTEEHIKGIEQLHNWLKAQDGVTELELEKWIPETKQRPDIYFKYRGEEYAIEFQCSPIATKFLERRDLYRLNGIKDIWILGCEKYRILEYIKSEGLQKRGWDAILYKGKAIESELYNREYETLYLNVKDNIIWKLDNEKRSISNYRSSFFAVLLYSSLLEFSLQSHLIGGTFLSESRKNYVIKEKIKRKEEKEMEKKIQKIMLEERRKEQERIKKERELELIETEKREEKLLDRRYKIVKKTLENISPYVEELKEVYNEDFEVIFDEEEICLNIVGSQHSLRVRSISKIKNAIKEKAESNRREQFYRSFYGNQYYQKIKSILKKEIDRGYSAIRLTYDDNVFLKMGDKVSIDKETSDPKEVNEVLRGMFEIVSKSENRINFIDEEVYVTIEKYEKGIDSTFSIAKNAERYYPHTRILRYIKENVEYIEFSIKYLYFKKGGESVPLFKRKICLNNEMVKCEDEEYPYKTPQELDKLLEKLTSDKIRELRYGQ